MVTTPRASYLQVGMICFEISSFSLNIKGSFPYFKYILLLLSITKNGKYIYQFQTDQEIFPSKNKKNGLEFKRVLKKYTNL
jgi:hypothetical protein